MRIAPALIFSALNLAPTFPGSSPLARALLDDKHNSLVVYPQQIPDFHSTFGPLPGVYLGMGTLAFHADLDTLKQHLDLTKNYLEMVVQPQEELLRGAMREYLESWEAALSRQTAIAA